MHPSQHRAESNVFSKYEVFLIAVLAILQFTVILDFMVISPLGEILMRELSITPSKFSTVVSAYAFSAGASALLSAGFADKFDRKRFLMFFYIGFLVGTALCAIAPTFEFLLIARIVTGLFGGVIGSTVFAIVTDIFVMQVRGRVMGFIQMAFSASQVLGIPIGLYLANSLGWHWSFWMIVFFGIPIGIVISIYMKPVNGHLAVRHEVNAFRHLITTVSKPNYLYGFLTTSLLACGGFMLMPFGSAFGIHNIGLTLDELPMVYLITGVFTFFAGPLAGKYSDSVGKYRVFVVTSTLAIVWVFVYTHLGQTPFWEISLISVLLMTAIMARMVPAQAIMTAIPAPLDRGAYMSVNSAVMMFAGGIASHAAGQIVTQTPSGMILHFETIGYVVISTIVVMMLMMYKIDRDIAARPPVSREPMQPQVVHDAA